MTSPLDYLFREMQKINAERRASGASMSGFKKDDKEKVEKNPPLRRTSYFIDLKDGSVWEYHIHEDVFLCISTPKKHVPGASQPDSFRSLQWEDE